MATTDLEFESAVPALDCTWRVEDVITRHPATIGVFNRFGIDTCCGAVLSVQEAAKRDCVDAEALCEELHAAARAHWRARHLVAHRSRLR